MVQASIPGGLTWGPWAGNSSSDTVLVEMPERPPLPCSPVLQWRGWSSVGVGCRAPTCLRLCARSSELKSFIQSVVCAPHYVTALPINPLLPMVMQRRCAQMGTKGEGGRDKAGNLASSRTLGGNSRHKVKRRHLLAAVHSNLGFRTES